MNERNVFKIRPVCYEELAKKYPEFRSKCFVGAGGKICVNFADPEAVRLLTKFLLLEYFELDVQIPVGSLVPRVPQRLNYVLLLEYLISRNKLDAEPIWGIDIGTGTICIYPLLGSIMNRWNFVATETEPTSISSAVDNINRNNLEEFIQIVQSTGDSIFQAVFSKELHSDEQFTFSMCNPPFFDPGEISQKFAKNPKENSESLKNFVGEIHKRGDRSPPRSATSASPGEIMYSGGEVAFVNRMVDESIALGTKIKIYTTMLGKLTSLQTLRRILQEKGIRNTTATLSQGKTARWVLIWTFCEDINLEKIS